MTGSLKFDFVEVLRKYGADEAALRLLDVDAPALLPYATLLSARNGGDEDLQAVGGIYEWQGTPLVFLVAADLLGEDETRLQRIRRVLAMRGDAPYLGVVGSGRSTSLISALTIAGRPRLALTSESLQAKKSQRWHIWPTSGRACRRAIDIGFRR